MARTWIVFGVNLHVCMNVSPRAHRVVTNRQCSQHVCGFLELSRATSRVSRLFFAVRFVASSRSSLVGNISTRTSCIHPSSRITSVKSSNKIDCDSGGTKKGGKPFRRPTHRPPVMYHNNTTTHSIPQHPQATTYRYLPSERGRTSYRFIVFI